MKRIRVYLPAILTASLTPAIAQEPPPPPPKPLPVVTVDRDDIEIRTSCLIRIAKNTFIPDDNGNGVLHVTGDNLTVAFHPDSASLRSDAQVGEWDLKTGIGIRITGNNVTLRDARVHRYKVGILANGTNNLVVKDCDVSEGYAFRLASTQRAEASEDWLWPHRNDGGEWAKNYGAGICVRNATDVVVERCRARKRQNGLLFEGVTKGIARDNDFSYLSGWGIGLWRSTHSIISRNALDYCIRGYSHGIYNRGQDSAGLLMFEQCTDNLIAHNSTTHCGDGIFVFAGREALGEHPPPDHSGMNKAPFDYAGKGCNRNTFTNNDCSFSSAHGLELTFSFDNTISANRFFGNGICGVWAGFSQRTHIYGNHFEANGDRGSGVERGGVNIEHGRDNRVENNTFSNNACGVHLFWDPLGHLAKLPWTEANYGDGGLGESVIGWNTFTDDRVAVELRGRNAPVKLEPQMLRNNYSVGQKLVETGNVASRIPERQPKQPPALSKTARDSIDPGILGVNQPLGTPHAAGDRSQIIMGPWFPWNQRDPVLQWAGRVRERHTYRFLGALPLQRVQLDEGAKHAGLTLQVGKPQANGSVSIAIVPPRGVQGAWPYALTAQAGAETLHSRGVMIRCDWKVRFFPWEADPAAAPNEPPSHKRWLAAAESAPFVHFTTDEIAFPFGGAGPMELGLKLEGTDAGIAAMRTRREHFGTLATTVLRLAPGNWTVSTVSDDGVRVLVDGQCILEEWTHHGSTLHRANFAVPPSTFGQTKDVEIRLEHFEIGGGAELRFSLSRTRE